MIKILAGFSSLLSLVIVLFSLFFLPFALEVNALSTKQNDALVERIARDFSKKFCNGVGFGLSQESAVNFAINENLAVFKKKKGIENLDSKAIVEKVSIAVDDKCGYLLDLPEDTWEITFKKGG